MSRNLNFAALLLLFVTSLFLGCQSNTGSNQTEETTESTKKVQAILLTQPFDYDNSDKNKITGDYVMKTQLVVPQNLEPQNKWVMFEGPVLENELIAYRFYMDSRHRNDIYGKKVNDLVMDTVSWQYHEIMDWGSDILKVGDALGIGSPAIWYQDTIYTLSDCIEKIVEITENGDTRASIRTTFKGLKIGDQTMDLVQDWSIEAGQPWCEIQLEVINGDLPAGMSFATGIVKHLEDYSEVLSNGFRYAFTWGKQSFHEENLGMGIIIKEDFQPEKIPNALSHAYVLKNSGNKVNYRFLAAWERDVMGVKDAAGFKNLIEQACQNLQ